VLRVAEEGSVAFERLQRIFRDPIFAGAAHSLSDPMDTEELFQEVFKKIWTDAADYDLRRWLGHLRFTRRHQASH
jgi:DNA-directed RNA polymerase specialized sigma24 family protein